MRKIPVKLDATKEQIQHMEYLKGNKSKLHNNQGQPLPYSKLGKYLIDNFGEKISNAIRKYKLDTKKTRQMKLYTEEQVIKAIKLARECDSDCWGVDFYNGTTDEIVAELTPIELPSDEEIDKASPEYNLYSDAMTFGKGEGFNLGAKWVIEQIK